MAEHDDYLRADPLQLMGMGVLGLAIPALLPGLRPQMAALLKAGAKLFLEAEFDADEALADRLVDTTVNTLLDVTSEESDKKLCDRSEATVKRFLAAAQADASRRGWDQADVARRYRKCLLKLDRAIARARRRAPARQRAALEHASELLKRHCAA